MMPMHKAIKKSSSDSFLSETCDTIEEAPKPIAATASRPPKKPPVRSMSMACLSEIGQEQTPQQPASARSESPSFPREVGRLRHRASLQSPPQNHLGDAPPPF